jgi:pimeloyl-ACP methyl ester carboxylesterase
MLSRAAVATLLTRGFLRAAAVVSPRAVDRFVVRRFATPSRKPQRIVGARVAAAPLSEPWWIQSQGEQIAVYTAGVGPRVLLAHGWSGSADDMGPLAGELRAAGFSIVTLDMPAHGRSSGKQTNLPDMARAIRVVADRVGPVAAVVGHSLGAAAALLAVREGLAAGGVVALSPPGSVRYYLESLTRALGLPRARHDAVVALMEQRFGDLTQFDGDVLARAVTVPGLVIHAIDDRAVPFSHGEAIAGAWRNCRLLALSGLGHRRPLQDPDVIEQIVGFVREAKDGSPTVSVEDDRRPDINQHSASRFRP